MKERPCCELCGIFITESNASWGDPRICLKCETDILIEDDIYYSNYDFDEL